uniref:Uncharacterized protein n=1 Tax=Octopus bimaculoides TaxID=37653 RepID=A0A0L8H0F5_OCTBM
MLLLFFSFFYSCKNLLLNKNLYSVKVKCPSKSNFMIKTSSDDSNIRIFDETRLIFDWGGPVWVSATCISVKLSTIHSGLLIQMMSASVDGI